MNPTFLKVVARDKNIGAISSSSRFLIKRVLDIIKKKQLNTVIEYGGGDGVMTKELLKLLPKTGRLFVIEQNVSFVKILKTIPDERLFVIHGNAQDAKWILGEHITRGVDLIISSVPFSWFTKEERRKLMIDSSDLLRAGGDIIFFHQYIPIAYLKMRKFFAHPKIYFVTMNLFPCFVTHATKPYHKEHATHSVEQ